MPPLSRTEAEYVTRINRVLDHIDCHLDAELDLHTLAAVAHFSPFHFHRIFAAWMGESLGDYLRRRRLEVAAAKLWARRDEAVLNIALSVGFGSGEAFARAFKKQFGHTPSQWQAQGPQARIDAYIDSSRERLRTTPSLLRNPDQADRKNDQAATHHTEDDGDSFPNTERSSTMQQPTSLTHIQLIERQPVRLAYLRHIGPYGPSVSRFWGERFAPFMLAHQFGDPPRYGIGHDDPSITADEKCRYDACAEVPEDFAPSASNPVDRGVGLSSLPGGRYVSARFEGNTDTMGPAWMWLFRTGLPEKGLVPGDTACFEHYWPSARFDAATGWFECDLCIPVA